MRIGYARVSKSEEQDTATQISALKDSGCERIFEESASGGRWDRPEMHRLLNQLRRGDILVVWKLDRLSRSLKDLLLILETVEAAGADFQSLTEAIDTTAPAGRMMMQMLGAFAEFERAMIRERTRAGLRHAWEQGRVSGRRPKLSKDQRHEIVEAVSSGRKSGAEVARLFQVHRSTVSRMLAQASVDSVDAKRGVFLAPALSTHGPHSHHVGALQGGVEVGEGRHSTEGQSTGPGFDAATTSEWPT